MVARTEIFIKKSKEDVWSLISDIEHSNDFITGITSIEVKNKPDNGLVGFKWREGRIMFGKEAYETMWITDAKDNTFYETRAESHGSVYISRLELEDTEGGSLLSMSFKSEPRSFMAKVSDKLLGKMMIKSTEEAFQKDLEDIKKKVESL